MGKEIEKKALMTWLLRSQWSHENASEDGLETYPKQDCTERIGPTGKWITHLKLFRFYFKEKKKVFRLTKVSEDR